MKRFLFTIALMVALVLFVEPVRNLVGEILKLKTPESHEITRGDWLSKVAEKNYGDVSYWRELALVNRAPNPDLIFPDEEIIIPSFEAIKEVREAGSLSAVNELVSEQQSILASKSQQGTKPQRDQEMTDRENDSKYAQSSRDAESGARVEEPEDNLPKQDNVAGTPLTRPEQTSPLEDSEGMPVEEYTDSFLSSTPLITGIIVLAVILIIGIVMALRNHNRNKYESETYGDDSRDSDNGSEKSWRGRDGEEDDQKEKQYEKEKQYSEIRTKNRKREKKEYT